MKLENKTWKVPRILFSIFVVIILFLYFNYLYIALFPVVYGVNMKEFALNRNTYTTELFAKRGTIYDSEGNILAINTTSYTVIAYLNEKRSEGSSKLYHVADKEGTAKALAPVLGMDESYLLGLLKQEGKYQVELGPEGRGITTVKKEEIQALGLPGIDFIESVKRYYPNGDFASYILGYAKTNDETGKIEGELGIEVKFNQLLQGTNGYLKYEQDRNGYKIPDTKEERVDAVNGSNIYLTIDSSIQRFLESAVKEASAKYEPEWMFLTVMDAKTGDILGISSTPSFDPNIRNIVNYENPLVSYVYEPGSTMKAFTYLCAIDKGTYKGDETYMSGSFAFGDDIVSDFNDVGWGTISYDLGFEYSSNTAIASMINHFITKSDLQDCYKKFGFGQLTNIALPREQAGDTKFTYPIEVASAGFGQGISITPIQMLQALTIIANKGHMLTPHIIRKVVDPNTDEVLYERQVEMGEALVKEESILQIQELMHNVIYGNNYSTTGISYRIDGFDLIGKTGTAEVYNTQTNSYRGGGYIHSFAGMYPREDPQIIIYGAIKKPKSSGKAGLVEATRSVMQNIAKYRNMFSQGSTSDSIQSIEVESYLNKDVIEVKQFFEEQKVEVYVLGGGNRIIEQYPSVGSTVLSYDKVFFLTNGNDFLMPDVTGWSRIDVIRLCKLLGISYELDGYGYVVEQSVLADTQIEEGMVLKVKLEPKFSSDPPS